MHDDTHDDDFTPYRPPRAELTMPEGPGGWRESPAFVSPLQGWRWIFMDVWEIMEERPLFWPVLVSVLWGVEYVWGALIENSGIADAFVRNLLFVGIVPLCAAVVFLCARQDLEVGDEETETGLFALSGGVLLRALPFCPLFAALVGGYLYGTGMFTGAVVQRLPEPFWAWVIAGSAGLGSGTSALMLFALTAEALAIMARLPFFTALFRAACALTHNCLAFALAALCFWALSLTCGEMHKDITAFAAKHGVNGAWLEPACAYLTEWLKAATLLLAPCRIARDIFYETGYNGREAGEL